MAVKRIICTHNGTFHCDDVLACCLIKFLPAYKDAQIIRTRDQEVIDKADIVLDVGGEYDPNRLRFDHHQKSFNLSLKDLNPKLVQHTIKLSSAGLVYHHFGREMLKELLTSFGSSDDDDHKLDIFYERIYTKFVKEIDGVDNGVTICENPPYEINTGISSRIAKFNLDWNEVKTDERFFDRFMQAIDYIREEFLSLVKQLNNIWWPARVIVANAIKNRFEADESGSIIEFKGEIIPPYLGHLFMLEKELGLDDKIKYAIFKDQNNYRVRAIPIHDNSFILRKPLPEKSRGLRDQQLCDIIGVPDCIFVHATGFIGGTKTRESAFKLAKLSLEYDTIENGIKRQKLS